jgi:hypothetical protein
MSAWSRRPHDHPPAQDHVLIPAASAAPTEPAGLARHLAPRARSGADRRAGLLPDRDGHKVPGYHNGWVSIPSETRCARSGSIHVLVFEDLPMPEAPGDRSAGGTW